MVTTKVKKIGSRISLKPIFVKTVRRCNFLYIPAATIIPSPTMKNRNIMPRRL